MKIIQISNPKYSSPDNLSIDCTITLKDGRVMPFTASANDSEQHGRDIFARLNVQLLQGI